MSNREYENRYLDSDNLLYRLSYHRAGQLSFCFGAYIGVCIDVIYLNGTIQKINVTKSFKKAFLRIIIVLLISSLFLLPRYLDLYHSNSTDYPLEHVLINFFVFFTIGIIFFSYLKVVFVWLKLVKEAPKNRFLI